MTKPIFDVVPIGGNCYTINDHSRTVAIVTSQGYIDWLLKSPLQPGRLLTAIRKETHLSYTLGLKLLLITPTPATQLQSFRWEKADGGSVLILRGHGITKDGAFVSDTEAVLCTDPAASRYEWRLTTTLTCSARESVSLRWVEYNNVYPAKAGLCLFWSRHKEYCCTLMVDREGTVWRFPHQHTLHYSKKISELHFAEGTMAGFFGEKTGSPIVLVEKSPLEPDWAICDMYYDLHCGARVTEPIKPGESVTFVYTVKYLSREESDALLSKSRPVEITQDDLRSHDFPRLDLGLNSFTSPAGIDRPDEASAFKTAPPSRVWDRDVGHVSKGSLRLTNEEPCENVWPAVPPSNIPPGSRLKIRAKVKTQNVIGKGIFIRLKYHTFVWHPEPHVEWPLVLESSPVNGTTDGWVTIALPELKVPEEHFDYLVLLEVVLDGKGVAWLTEMDLDFEEASLQADEIHKQVGKQKPVSRRARKKAPAGAGATS